MTCLNQRTLFSEQLAWRWASANTPIESRGPISKHPGPNDSNKSEHRVQQYSRRCSLTSQRALISRTGDFITDWDADKNGHGPSGVWRRLKIELRATVSGGGSGSHLLPIWRSGTPLDECHLHRRSDYHTRCKTCFCGTACLSCLFWYLLTDTQNRAFQVTAGKKRAVSNRTGTDPMLSIGPNHRIRSRQEKDDKRSDALV